MVNFRDLKLKNIYWPPEDDIVVDFLVPALERADEYKMASGYFSSTSLAETAVGICSLVKRGGTIKIITSPRLSKEDVIAIKNGYDKAKVIGDSMVRSFISPEDLNIRDRLSFLSELIARNIVDIKIGVMRNLDNYPNSVFHAKFGLLYDSGGNRIVYRGSMNESENGMFGNWEHMDVTLEDCYQIGIVGEYEVKFDNLWKNNDTSTLVIDMPDALKDMLEHYRTGELNLDLDQRMVEKKLLDKHRVKGNSVFFKSPDYLEARSYQLQAVQEWIDHGYRGIFEMATGTGKTKTALCALEQLYNSKPDEKIITVIVAPLKHLVEQWEEEVRNFGVIPIIGHSESSVKNWKERFGRIVVSSKVSNRNDCLIITINSFSSNDFQKLIAKIDNLAILVDEAHNMGSENRFLKLPENAKYRLALSATIDRYKDSVGTEHLRNYFGPTCIKLSLHDAIAKGYLTRYYYYPVCCEYNDSEYNDFISANKELNCVLSDPEATHGAIEKAKNEYIRRSYTLNAGMKSKFRNLENLLRDFRCKDHFLIYCGKTRISESGDLDIGNLTDSKRVIDKVSTIVGMKGLGFIISRITYQEDLEVRKRVLDEFEKGEIAGIVAISCLDEGVDMPSVQTAVILTSSNNPREYVQRRGRVLRLFPGKEHATIYDMIVVPKDLKKVDPGGVNSGLELKLLAKELHRMKEFAVDSSNPEVAQEIFTEISDVYGVGVEEIMEKYGEDYE